MPAAMTMQAPSTASTARMGVRGGLDPETECLPVTRETDVLTTIRSRALPVALPGVPGRGLARAADLLEQLSPSVVSPLLAGGGLVRDGAGRTVLARKFFVYRHAVSGPDQPD